MGKKGIKGWKETSKSDIEKSNSLLQFFSDKMYWANKKKLGAVLFGRKCLWE